MQSLTHYFTQQEMNSLLQTARRRSSRGSTIDKVDFSLIVFGYATGCRVSEIASTSLDANEPNYLDLLRTGTLRIREAKHRSVGVLPIDVDSLRQLKWYVREVRPKLKNSTEFRHLFLTKVGRPYSPNVLTQKFSLLLKRFGYPEKSAHSFRHFYATSLLGKGVQPHVVQALCRHKDARTTLGIYAHPSPDDLKSAVNRRVG